MTRVLLLDLDDTLVDRDAVLTEWARRIADDHEDPAMQSWLVAYDKENGRVRDRADFLGAVAQRLGWTDTVEELLRAWPQMFGARYRLDPDLRAALRRARQTGCRLAVVTNGDAEVQWAKIRAMELEPEVDACLVSGEVGIRKPAPQLFALAAEAAGTTLKDAWMVGDDPVADIGGGWAAGARPIWVNRPNNPWPARLRPPYWQCKDPVNAVNYVINHP